MDIRHKVDKGRVVQNVVWDPRSSSWIKVILDMTEVYAPRYWEDADMGSWETIGVTLEKEGTVLMDRNTHVAGTLHCDYRFVVLSGNVIVEKRK